jgi:hypothetical protein
MINKERTDTYRSFQRMHDRCNRSYLEKNKCYRDVKVCDRWNNFENFIEDMGLIPKNMTLDRIDNTKGYYKENCRWADKKTQHLNRRTTIIVEYKGKKEYLIDLIRKSGVKRETAISRYNLGYSIEKVLEKKYIKDCRAKQLYFFKGKKRSAYEIAKMTGINSQMLKHRLKKGLNLKDAITKPSQRNKKSGVIY